MKDFQRQHIDTTRLPAQVLEKWSSAVLSEGFVPFPKRLVRSLHRLFSGEESMKDLSALLAIVDFKRPNLTRTPSLDYLAFLAGLDEDEFKASLLRLQARGYVQVFYGAEGLDTNLDGLLQAIEKETQ